MIFSKDILRVYRYIFMQYSISIYPDSRYIYVYIQRITLLWLMGLDWGLWKLMFHELQKTLCHGLTSKSNNLFDLYEHIVNIDMYAHFKIHKRNTYTYLYYIYIKEKPTHKKIFEKNLLLFDRVVGVVYVMNFFFFSFSMKLSHAGIENVKTFSFSEF